MAAQSKTWAVFGRSNTEVLGSNQIMDVCVRDDDDINDDTSDDAGDASDAGDDGDAGDDDVEK